MKPHNDLEVINEYWRKLSEAREEVFQLKLSLVEIKGILDLAQKGYRNIDEAITKINETLNVIKYE